MAEIHLTQPHIQRPINHMLGTPHPKATSSRRPRRGSATAARPKVLGFHPGPRRWTETTTTPPRRSTAPVGVAVVVAGHGQPGLSPGLPRTIAPKRTNSVTGIDQATRRPTPPDPTKRRQREEIKMAASRSDDGPPKLPNRHPPPQQPRRAASTRARRPPPSQRRLHLPGPPPRLPSSLQGKHQAVLYHGAPRQERCGTPRRRRPPRGLSPAASSGGGGGGRERGERNAFLGARVAPPESPQAERRGGREE